MDNSFMNSSFRFKTIGDVLKERGLITKEELHEGLENQKTTGLPLGQIFVNLSIMLGSFGNESPPV